MNQPQILCIDDEPALLDTLRRLLQSAGYEPTLAASGEEGLVALDRFRPDVVITDLMMPGVGGMEILARSKDLHPNVPVVLITAYATLETAIQAIKKGAWDYVAKPFTNDQLLIVLDRALATQRLRDENQRLRQQLGQNDESAGIVGTSAPMMRVLDMIRRIAPTDLGVLITGESGTGKEVVARAIHRMSLRHDKPFVPVDCGAIPQNLMESELFGHEKGAFTGAGATRRGLVEAADSGTFFLDEIGELGPAMQVKFLRLLQEGEYRRVGGASLRTADLRVLAATNRDLEQAISEGRFREDLYHRINIVRIQLPPLRDRPGDVPLLAKHFMERLLATSRRGQLHVPTQIMEILESYSWPGNVRELLNCCQYLVALAPGPSVGVDDLPAFLQMARARCHREPAQESAPAGRSSGTPSIRHDLPYKRAKRLWLEHFERDYISHLLEGHGGNISKAARAAGIDRKSIQRLMKRTRISLDETDPRQ